MFKRVCPGDYVQWDLCPKEYVEGNSKEVCSRGYAYGVCRMSKGICLVSMHSWYVSDITKSICSSEYVMVCPMGFMSKGIFSKGITRKYVQEDMLREYA